MRERKRRVVSHYKKGSYDELVVSAGWRERFSVTIVRVSEGRVCLKRRESISKTGRVSRGLCMCRRVCREIHSPMDPALLYSSSSYYSCIILYPSPPPFPDGILSGILALTKNATKPYFLFLERDFQLIQPAHCVHEQLSAGLRLLKSGKVHALRYRDRRQPGRPNWAAKMWVGIINLGEILSGTFYSLGLRMRPPLGLSG